MLTIIIIIIHIYDIGAFSVLITPSSMVNDTDKTEVSVFLMLAETHVKKKYTEKQMIPLANKSWTLVCSRTTLWEKWEEGKVSSGVHLNLACLLRTTGNCGGIWCVCDVASLSSVIMLRLANDIQMLAIWGHIWTGDSGCKCSISHQFL